MEKPAPPRRRDPAPEPPAAHSSSLPWARLRSATAGPQAFRRMIDAVDPKARPGDLVAVYDKAGNPYGAALYNPKSLISLRLITRELSGFEAEAFFTERIARAVELRRSVLGLDRTSDAYRLVHDHGDGLPGLVVDRYGDHLVLEFYSLGMFRQAERLERLFEKHYPGAKFIHRASSHSEKMEGFSLKEAPPLRVRIEENGVLFEADLTGGYKTGFFCDQRENRLALAELARGRKVLDLFSYTGGFGLYAKKLGQAAEVTCVELDPEASAQARRNANINQLRLDTVCVDAFPYLRQAAANQRLWDLVILDPYKLIATREGFSLGRKKYLDLNRLVLGAVEPGGFLLTCSCSGLLSWEEFQQIVRAAAGSARRRLQILRKSGAGPDHPVAADYPEGEYLKALWCRVL